MINRRFLSVLAFAFVVAGCASMVLYRLVTSRMGADAPLPTSAIVVATRNLESGAVIVEADLRIEARPGELPLGVVVKVAEVMGRGVSATIYANEPVIAGRLVGPGGGGGLAATIPSGMRAVAVRVNEVVGVAGFVVTGSHVDVLVSGNFPQGATATGGNITQTLLQNISVLSAGQDFKKDTEGKPVMVQVVNLLVKPEQAEMLSLASSQTTIQLVLRNPLDTNISAVPAITLSTLFSGTGSVLRTTALTRRQKTTPSIVGQAIEVEKPAELLRMEIIEGSKRSEVKLHSLETR